MTSRNLLRIAAIACAATRLAACARPDDGADSREHAHAEDANRNHAGPEEKVAKGPRGGRLLREGPFALEVVLIEQGVPPELRVYAFRDDRPLDPKEITLTIELHRLGDKSEVIRFRGERDYLLGDRVVEEPHSFDVEVSAAFEARNYRWKYGSYEGRVRLAAEAAKRSGIVVETAGPARLATTLRLYGKVVANEDRVTHVIGRFPGVVKEVRKKLGDRVDRGEALAVVESNESLRRYEVKSELAGTVIAKHATVGEFAREEDPLFVVADLSTVWVDLNVYRHDFARLKNGQTVVLDAGADIRKETATIDYVSPLGAESTQTTLARIVLPNPKGDWRPGLFVTGEVIVEEVTVPLAVRASALQTLSGSDVVFVNEDDVYEARPITPGRRDGQWVEVLAGLEPGQRYVAEQSFILKADVGKAGATHEH